MPTETIPTETEIIPAATEISPTQEQVTTPPDDLSATPVEATTVYAYVVAHGRSGRCNLMKSCAKP